jgi:hypothetical protein
VIKASFLCFAAALRVVSERRMRDQMQKRERVSRSRFEYDGQGLIFRSDEKRACTRPTKGVDRA